MRGEYYDVENEKSGQNTNDLTFYERKRNYSIKYHNEGKKIITKYFKYYIYSKFEMSSTTVYMSKISYNDKKRIYAVNTIKLDDGIIVEYIENDDSFLFNHGIDEFKNDVKNYYSRCVFRGIIYVKNNFGKLYNRLMRGYLSDSYIIC